MANGFLLGTVFDKATTTPIYYCKDQISPLVVIVCKDTGLVYAMYCVNGQYAFYLPAGTYNITVTCSGYTTKNIYDKVVTPEKKRRVLIYL